MAPFVTEASTFADALRSSWESTTPGKPRMWIGSPILTFFDSASLKAGISEASTESSARSRPDMTPAPVWVLTGGLYFSTLAGSRKPLAMRMKIEALPGQLFVHAGRDDGLLGLLVDQPRRRLMGGLDDVGVGYDPSVGVDEPTGARLAEWTRRDLALTRSAIEDDLGGHLRDDEHRGRLGPQDDLLQGHRLRRPGAGRGLGGEDQDEPGEDTEPRPCRHGLRRLRFRDRDHGLGDGQRGLGLPHGARVLDLRGAFAVM